MREQRAAEPLRYRDSKTQVHIAYREGKAWQLCISQLWQRLRFENFPERLLRLGHFRTLFQKDTILEDQKEVIILSSSEYVSFGMFVAAGRLALESQALTGTARYASINTHAAWQTWHGPELLGVCVCCPRLKQDSREKIAAKRFRASLGLTFDTIDRYLFQQVSLGAFGL